MKGNPERSFVRNNIKNETSNMAWSCYKEINHNTIKDVSTYADW